MKQTLDIKRIDMFRNEDLDQQQQETADALKHDGMNLTPEQREIYKFFLLYFNENEELASKKISNEKNVLMQEPKPTSLDRQINGDHYASMKIQPWAVMESIFTREELTAYHIGSVLAYLMRHKAKGGEQDIRKAQHHLTRLCEVFDETPAL
jgi:hypothetical protein